MHFLSLDGQVTLVLTFLVLAGIGILDTLYLSYHALKKTHVACLGFHKAWCEKVQFSVYSTAFGIPNPYLGLIGYIAIFVLTLLFSAGYISLWPIGAMITIGFLLSMYFTYFQLTVIRAFCTWCLISALDFTLLFLMLVLLPY